MEGCTLTGEELTDNELSPISSFDDHDDYELSADDYELSADCYELSTDDYELSTDESEDESTSDECKESYIDTYEYSDDIFRTVDNPLQNHLNEIICFSNIAMSKVKAINKEEADNEEIPLFVVKELIIDEHYVVYSVDKYGGTLNPTIVKGIPKDTCNTTKLISIDDIYHNHEALLTINDDVKDRIRASNTIKNSDYVKLKLKRASKANTIIKTEYYEVGNFGSNFVIGVPFEDPHTHNKYSAAVNITNKEGKIASLLILSDAGVYDNCGHDSREEGNWTISFLDTECEIIIEWGDVDFYISCYIILEVLKKLDIPDEIIEYELKWEFESRYNEIYEHGQWCEEIMKENVKNKQFRFLQPLIKRSSNNSVYSFNKNIFNAKNTIDIFNNVYSNILSTPRVSGDLKAENRKLHKILNVYKDFHSKVRYSVDMIKVKSLDNDTGDKKSRKRKREENNTSRFTKKRKLKHQR